MHVHIGIKKTPRFLWAKQKQRQVIFEFKFDQQMRSGANDQATILQFTAFRDHGYQIKSFLLVYG